MVDCERALNDPLADALFHATPKRPERECPVNLKPLPHEIGGEYEALHGELCGQVLEGVKLQGDIAVMWDAWKCLSRRGLEVAGNVAAAARERELLAGACEQRQAAIRSQLHALFAQWCKERGTDPACYVEELKASY